MTLRRSFTSIALLLAAFAFLPRQASAQDTTDYAEPKKPKEPKRPFKDRLYFGGGLGLSFGTVTAIQLEPFVGVHLDEKNKLSTGLGINYWYFNDSRYQPPIELTGYGYRTFLRYRFIPQLFAHTEFLHMNVDRYRFGSGETIRLWVPHLLVGAGYVQQLGGGASIYLQALWEVLQDPNSVYYNQGPIVSGGVGVGF